MHPKLRRRTSERHARRTRRTPVPVTQYDLHVLSRPTKNGQVLSQRREQQQRKHRSQWRLCGRPGRITGELPRTSPKNAYNIIAKPLRSASLAPGAPGSIPLAHIRSGSKLLRLSPPTSLIPSCSDRWSRPSSAGVVTSEAGPWETAGADGLPAWTGTLAAPQQSQPPTPSCATKPHNPFSPAILVSRIWSSLKRLERNSRPHAPGVKANVSTAPRTAAVSAIAQAAGSDTLLPTLVLSDPQHGISRRSVETSIAAIAQWRGWHRALRSRLEISARAFDRVAERHSAVPGLQVLRFRLT